jgi:hypothetical protein
MYDSTCNSAYDTAFCCCYPCCFELAIIINAHINTGLQLKLAVSRSSAAHPDSSSSSCCCCCAGPCHSSCWVRGACGTTASCICRCGTSTPGVTSKCTPGVTSTCTPGILVCTYNVPALLHLGRRLLRPVY